ncbi:MAG: dihydrolipoyl dehydrogenase [Spirochaetaceae bacterium]|jgi:dihydrolipoamide dehydrogenase|nr:dihydrolipoyl dehydrogenase [Spirochaetaceae bacterium]
MEERRSEVVVLGGGPGGYTAAFRAADLGKQVTIVENRANLGGVCLNVGCIPSKSLLHLAEIIEQSREASSHGVVFEPPKLNLDKIRSHKRDVVGTLTKGLSGLAKKRKVQVINGSGSFISQKELLITTEEGEIKLHFDYAIIAAGSRPVEIPIFPNNDSRIWDSTDALELREIPKKLFILGGGIIGLEMATVYQALGSEITIVEMLDQLIPISDADMVKPLLKRLQAKGMKIHLSTKVESIKPTSKGLEILYGETTELFDAALISVGRKPNTDRIGIENTDVKIDKQGFIPVDLTRRTNINHIFAIGDLTGQPMLAHKAVHEGKVAAEIIAGKKTAFEPMSIPSVAYTSPEIAWTGLTEKQAKEQKIEYTTSIFPWAASGRAISQGSNDGITKFLFDKETKRIIGASIVGAHAGELIAEANLALEMGADAEDLSGSIHAHPTLSETLALASEVFLGTVTDI